MSIWEWTTFDRIVRPSSTTAAEVSSHDDSIPRIFSLVLRGLRVLLEDAGLDLRRAAFDLRLEDLDAGLELKVLEAFGSGGPPPPPDAPPRPRPPQPSLLPPRHHHPA